MRIRRPAIEPKTCHSAIARRLIRAAHLTENLRFADHHRLQSCRDPKCVLHRAGPVEGHAGRRGDRGQALEIAQRPLNDGCRWVVRGVGVYLCAVAGGQQEALVHTGQRPNRRQRFRHLCIGKDKAGAERHRRGFVVDPGHQDGHGCAEKT
ncbi:MAG: hypothetical protein HYU43_01295 [Armatimonadetes bacterium]|nr:hypothetical protein [Armatimonadota bacterium]